MSSRWRGCFPHSPILSRSSQRTAGLMQSSLGTFRALDAFVGNAFVGGAGRALLRPVHRRDAVLTGAKVLNVTADAVNHEKRAAIFQTTKIDLEGKNDQSGTRHESDCRDSRRGVIEFFLSPIQRFGDDDLRER